MIITPTSVPNWPAGSATKDSGTPQEGAAGNRATWLKEMEKQAMTSWLSHEVQPAQPAAPSVYARINPPAAPAPEAGGMAASARPQSGAADGLESSAPEPDGAGDSARAGARDMAQGRAAQHAGDDEAHAGAAVSANEGTDQAASAMSVPAAADPARDGLVEAVMSRLRADNASGVQAMQRDAAGPKASGAEAPAPRAAATAPAAFRLGPLAAAAAALPAPGDEPPQTPANAKAPGAETAEQAQRRAGAAAGGRQADGSPLPPLRIHAVWTDQAVRVWIGADQAAGLTGQQLAYAAQDIRRLLKEQGASLESLTYNGEAVLAPEHPAGPMRGAVRQAGATAIAAPRVQR